MPTALPSSELTLCTHTASESTATASDGNPSVKNPLKPFQIRLPKALSTV